MKNLGRAFVSICQDCGESTYGTHKTYATHCAFCGSENVNVEISDKDVWGEKSPAPGFWQKEEVD